MPLISVIVPVFCVEPYLRKCVDSILAQTFKLFELILVDDGSPDNCGAICDEYAKKDGRVKVIHQKNGGVSSARNAGLDWVFANSDGQYVAFVDADDWVSERYIEMLLAGIRLGADIACCAIEQIGIEDQYERHCSAEVKLISPSVYWRDGRNFYGAIWGKIFKKSLFEDIRFPIGRTLHEDEFVAFKLVFAVDKVAFVTEPLYKYDVSRVGGAHSKTFGTDNLFAIELFKSEMELFQKLGHKDLFTETAQKLAWVYSMAIKKLHMRQLRKPLRRLLRENEIPLLACRCGYKVAYPVLAHILILVHRVLWKKQ